jgi:prephenate dehydrogenase
MSTQITIIGTGLIGGSLAKALRKSGFADVIVGYDHDKSELEQSQQLGVIDRSSTDIASAVVGSEIVILAVPVLATEAVLDQIKTNIGGATIITDVGSSKAAVVAAAKKSLGASFNRFVPGHPIAGREQSGIAAAETDLFRGHRIILTPLEETDLQSVHRVTAMWESVGAEVKCLGVEQHDLVLGATSHLPHVLAYATVDTLAGSEYVDEIFEFAAGGFRDFTRIASSNPIMWRDICLTNKTAILNVLDRFESHLAKIRGAIEDEDSAALVETFANAKKIRDSCLTRKSV